jgi:hypothetical protein
VTFLVTAHGVSIDRTVRCVGGFRPKSAERPVRMHLLRIGALDRTRAKPRDDGGKLLPIWAVTSPVSPVVSNRSWFSGGNIAWVDVLTRLNVPKRAIFAARILAEICYLMATDE